MTKWILCVLVSSGIGSLLYGLWYIMSRQLDRNKYVAVMYHSLHVVTVFFSLFAFCGIAVSIILERIPTGTFWGYHDSTVEAVAGIICAVWLGGAVWNLTRYVYFHLLHGRMVRSLHSCREEVLDVSRQVAEDLGIRGPLRMGTGNVLFTAELSGWHSPWVLLPDYEYTREQLEGIVAHELTHFLHGDRWIRELAVVTHCVHWFNPLVLALHRSLEEWDELYCDSCVCAYAFISKKGYAGTLLYMSEQFVQKKKSILDVAFSERGTYMIERLHCILDQTGEKAKRSTTITITLLFVMVGTMAAMGAGCATYRAYDEFTAGSLNEVPESEQPETIWKEEKEMLGSGVLSEYIPGYVEQIASSSASFQCVLEHGRWASGGFQAWAGQNIAVALFAEKNTPLQVGLLDANGWYRYVSGSGDIAHTFQLEETGKYYLVIRSESTEPVEVNGIYFTRGEAGMKQAEDIKGLSLFPHKNGEYSRILEAEEAYQLYQEIGQKVDKRELPGKRCSEDFPEKGEWERYQFGHYVTIQDQGDAFTVTIHVMTVFDGLRERAALVWLEDEPRGWEDYLIYDSNIHANQDSYIVGGTDADSPLFLSGDYCVRITADRDNETILHMKRFGFVLDSQQQSWNYDHRERFDCTIYDSVFRDSEKRREILRKVWAQLTEGQKEQTQGTWENGTIKWINVAEEEKNHPEYRPHKLWDAFYDEYYDQDIYLFSFPKTGAVVADVAVLVESKEWNIIGFYDYQGKP